MKQIGNILFVTENDVRLHLSGKAVEALRGKEKIAHIPIHHIEGIVSFAYEPLTAAAMSKLADLGIAFTALSPGGRLRFQLCGKIRGNVLLRKAQILRSEESEFSFPIAREMICAKIQNAVSFVSEYRNNHPADASAIISSERSMRSIIVQIRVAECESVLRGLEGIATKTYF